MLLYVLGWKSRFAPLYPLSFTYPTSSSFLSNFGGCQRLPFCSLSFLPYGVITVSYICIALYSLQNTYCVYHLLFSFDRLVRWIVLL